MKICSQFVLPFSERFSPVGEPFCACTELSVKYLSNKMRNGCSRLTVNGSRLTVVILFSERFSPVGEPFCTCTVLFQV